MRLPMPLLRRTLVVFAAVGLCAGLGWRVAVRSAPDRDPTRASGTAPAPMPVAGVVPVAASTHRAAASLRSGVAAQQGLHAFPTHAVSAVMPANEMVVERGLSEHYKGVDFSFTSVLVVPAAVGGASRTETIARFDQRQATLDLLIRQSPLRPRLSIALSTSCADVSSCAPPPCPPGAGASCSAGGAQRLIGDLEAIDLDPDRPLQAGALIPLASEGGEASATPAQEVLRSPRLARFLEEHRLSCALWRPRSLKINQLTRNAHRQLEAIDLEVSLVCALSPAGVATAPGSSGRRGDVHVGTLDYRLRLVAKLRLFQL